jgi:hypothetical protein
MKINMIKSQLKRFEIFQDESKIFVKIPSIIDLDELDCKDEGVVFHTIDEVEYENTISSDSTILECDINKLDSEDLLHLLTE